MGATAIGGMDAINIGGIVIGSALIVYGVFRLLRQFFFLKKSCTAQVAGTVLDMERNVKTSSDDSSSTVTYYMKYKYLVDGAEYVKKRTVSRRQYKAVGRHDNFTVLYDPLKPKRHYVIEIKFRMILTLGLIAIGAILLWVFLFL